MEGEAVKGRKREGVTLEILISGSGTKQKRLDEC